MGACARACVPNLSDLSLDHDSLEGRESDRTCMLVNHWVHFFPGSGEVVEYGAMGRYLRSGASNPSPYKSGIGQHVLSSTRDEQSQEYTVSQ